MNIEQAYIRGFVKRAAVYGFNHAEAVNILKTANFVDATNKAIQSQPGQKVLGTVSNLYNKLPNQIKSPVQNYLASKQAPESYINSGFTPDAKAGTYVNAQTTTINNGAAENRVRTSTPGSANSPLRQIAGTMTAGGNMPRATYAQGSPVANFTEMNNDSITSTGLQPIIPSTSPSNRGAFFNK
jgi:hypothetical protein